MPGIVGFLTKMPRAWAEPKLLQMVEAIRHESFYTTGTWIDESLGVYVGWAARRDSFSDGMPVFNETRDVVLVFSGEEFPEPGTERRLEQSGHLLNCGGPSYLVHLYEEDPNFPAGLNGTFHGLVIDHRLGTTTLFNDRYGMQRLYYHETTEAFYFAAEAKAILAVRAELRNTSPQALGEFISFGCVLENRTLFEGIHVLPSGAAWVFRNCSIDRRNTYFEPSLWENQTPLEPHVYYHELREVFARNLPRYFKSDERIGVSLTGGLDTRMIMAWWKAAPGSLPCYSFGGTYRASQDLLLARRVATMCHQPHENIRVGDEFLTNFANYAERTVYLTDGCADVSCSPVLYANQRAREIAPVRMTGNYGGEVLRRVVAFKPVAPSPGLFDSGLLPYLSQARDTYARLLRSHPLSFAVFRQAPWHHYGLVALERTQLSMRSPYLDNDFVRTVYRAPESSCANDDVCLNLIADGSEALSRLRTDRGGVRDRGRLRAAVSTRLLEFTFKAEYAYDYGMPQWLANIDHLLSSVHLERLFLGRHKYYHFRIWYKNALAAYLKEVLLDPRTLSRSFLERKALERVVNGHLSGGRNYTSAIHKVLTLELLHRSVLRA
jgi:asparagine synthase (glutamine-hydrolysing)